jgi:hypothetical protein
MGVKMPPSGGVENVKERVKVPVRPEAGLLDSTPIARWIARARGRADVTEARQKRRKVFY